MSCELAAYINYLLAVYERPQQFPWTSNWESWSHFLWPFVKVLLKLRLFYLNCQHCIILRLKNANILFCQAKQRFEKIAFFAWSIYPMGVQLHIHQCYYRLGFLCWAKILTIANVMGGPVTLIGGGYMNPVIWVLLFRKKLHGLAFNCNSQPCSLGQTPAWFCLAKGEKCIEQLWQM